MTKSPSNTRRFVNAAWSLLSFQVIASMGAVGVTGWAALHVQRLVDPAVQGASVNDGAALISIPSPAGGERTLTAMLGPDPDGAGTSPTFQWLRDGEFIADATAAIYVLSADDYGHEFAVRADYVDGENFRESVMSLGVRPPPLEEAPSSFGGRSEPSSNQGAAAITIRGEAREGQTLTAIVGADPEGAGTRPAFHWLRDGQTIADATSGTYALAAADAGRAITVRADYVDGRGFVESVTSAVVQPTALPPVNAGAATIAIRRDEGAESMARLLEQLLRTGDHSANRQSLAVTLGVDPDGAGSAPTLQWMRDGEPIPGAVGSTYRTEDADVGHAVAVRADYVDGEGFRESVVSEPELIAPAEAPPG